MLDRPPMTWCARLPSPWVRQYLPEPGPRQALAPEPEPARAQGPEVVQRRAAPRQQAVVPQPAQPPVLRIHHHNRVLPRPFAAACRARLMASRPAHPSLPIQDQAGRDLRSHLPATVVEAGRTVQERVLVPVAPVRAVV